MSRAPEAFVCPITGELMLDPVILSDGWSFERSAAESWLRTSALSPLTGERLGSLAIIPNKNLKKAIHWYSTHGAKPIQASPDDETVSIPAIASRDDLEKIPSAFYPSAPIVSAFQGAVFDFGLPGFEIPGPAIRIAGRIARRVTEASDWYRTIVFVNRAMIERTEFLITETSGEWGGIVVGVTRVDYKKALGNRMVSGQAMGAHELGFNGVGTPYSSESLMRLIDEDSWFLNGQGWFHSPDGDVLAGWSTGNLKAGDRVALEIVDKQFSIRVNGVIKCTVRDANCVGAPLWPWIGLAGSCVAVELTEP